MIISGFSLVKGISSWEIHLVIKGIGEQAIINETFYKAPTRVNVKGTDEPSCSKICNLTFPARKSKLILIIILKWYFT